MDPITAAALLVATSAGAAVGSEAGKQAWAGVTALVKLVKSKFTGDPKAEQALELAQADPENEAATQQLEAEIRTHADQDPGFATELTELTNQPQAQALAQQASGKIVTQLRDNASIGKQVNIGGDSHGNISL